MENKISTKKKRQQPTLCCPHPTTSNDLHQVLYLVNSFCLGEAWACPPYRANKYMLRPDRSFATRPPLYR